MARYLLAASPIPGHVTPMIAVAADLRRRGHEIALLTGAAFRPAVVRAGVRPLLLPAAAHPRPITPRRGPLPDVVRRWRTGRAELLSGFLAPLTSQYAALATASKRDRYDAVLVDVMYTGAIPFLLSERPRPPVLACGVVPLMLSSADTPPFGIGWRPRAGRDYTTMNRFVHDVLFRADQARLDAALRELAVARAPVFFLDWPVLADRILQFTVPGFEYPRRDLPSSVVFTGPVPPPADTEPASPDRWDVLDRGRTVVLVTQGTWDNADLGQLIRPTLSALGGRDDLVVVATTGGSSAPIGPVPANAMVLDYVPYSRLLPHVDVMITNGGYGGVQQALGHGIPVIVAGDTADKPEIAARAAHFGAGIDLGTARPRPDRIAAAVDRLLSADAYRAGARRLAADMANHTPFETIAQVLASLPRPPRARPSAGHGHRVRSIRERRRR
ncbi:nucleotide disphospho-sugar-binding domain-containing protein [Nocardia sp. NPDC005366]|uniref:glycosyltransferase n=1 Tax=Nocardia sp. NPDC005366 TaxID=3156878 RepID=UPI0033A33790